jgi:hypothetical protein
MHTKFSIPWYYCKLDRDKTGASGPQSGCARDFVNFRGKNHASRAQGPDLTMTGRCQLSSSAGSSKIKIRTSSCSKANLALLHDEVRILIFDDPAELESWQRPVMVRSGSGPFRPARPRRARAMHDFFPENLRNPAHNRCAGLMRQFCPGQLYSSEESSVET